MRLEMTGQMRMEQRMKLAPHMIQSMEILQLPLLALQERIEQELNNNPVLELEEPEGTDEDLDPVEPEDNDLAEKDLVVSADDQNADDFERLDSLDSDFSDLIDQSGPIRNRGEDRETDSKLQALKNTAAPPQSLYQYLMEQWHLVDATEAVKKAGEAIIGFINARGYLSVRIEQLYHKDRHEFTFEDLQTALDLIQQLEPSGVGARDIKECLIIQMAQSNDDMSFEMEMVSQHMQLLLENRLPEIAKKMHCSLEQIGQSFERLRKLDTSPGLQISQIPTIPITPDVMVVPLEEDSGYDVHLVDHSLPSLRMNSQYIEMAKDTAVSDNTRQFLRSNIRSAQWIIDAIEQRKNTLLRVTRSIVDHQRDFFDKGSLHLKPLPMAKVADDVGVHVATVSRAVAGKYMQCPWGVLPLRKFFSGGKEDASGQERSWEAIRVQLQKIINEEDKANPLNDDQIREKLMDAGFTKIARRTVAKYRGLMNIPTARFRKKY